MREYNNRKAFLALLKAGLWEADVKLLPYGEIDYEEIIRLAEEQMVTGLVTVGLEHVVDVKVPQEDLLQFIGASLQIEQRNREMNHFIARLVKKMRVHGIYTLLVKGQGVAQCYERPLWRASGDVDLYLSETNYQAANDFLRPQATNIDEEDTHKRHLGMTIDKWIVELHGSMYTYISGRINRILDKVHRDIFYNGNVRSWDNEGVQVFMPNPNNDVIIVFTHFINHFYGEGIGLRQICDWCRLLYCFREKLDSRLLESRIREAGLMTEWKAFAAFAVEYLGMPVEAMPFYNENHTTTFKRKAERIMELVLKSEKFVQNRDEDYRERYKGQRRHFITFWVRLKGFARLATIFPVNALKFFVIYTLNRVKAVS